MMWKKMIEMTLTLNWAKNLSFYKLYDDYFRTRNSYAKNQYRDKFLKIYPDFSNHKYTIYGFLYETILRKKILYIGQTSKLLFERIFKGFHEGLRETLFNYGHSKNVKFIYAEIIYEEEVIQEGFLNELKKAIVDLSILEQIIDFRKKGICKDLIVEKTQNKLVNQFQTIITKKSILQIEKKCVFQRNDEKLIQEVKSNQVIKIIENNDSFLNELIERELIRNRLNAVEGAFIGKYKPEFCNKGKDDMKSIVSRMVIRNNGFVPSMIKDIEVTPKKIYEL